MLGEGERSDPGHCLSQQYIRFTGLVKALICSMSWDLKNKLKKKKKGDRTPSAKLGGKGGFYLFGSLAISEFQKENQSLF